MRTRYCIRDVQRVDFREWFSFKSGSHYNRNCVIKPQLALGLLHNKPFDYVMARPELTDLRARYSLLSGDHPALAKGGSWY